VVELDFETDESILKHLCFLAEEDGLDNVRHLFKRNGYSIVVGTEFDGIRSVRRVIGTRIIPIGHIGINENGKGYYKQIHWTYR
jgi:hypothetical protein